MANSVHLSVKPYLDEVKGAGFVAGTDSLKNQSDILIMLNQELSQRQVGRIAFDNNVQNNVLEDVVNINDKGVLTGIRSQLYSNAANPSSGFVKVTIDGVALTNLDYFPTSVMFTNSIGTDFWYGIASLSFNHRFNTSLRVEHRKDLAGGELKTVVSYTID